MVTPSGRLFGTVHAVRALNASREIPTSALWIQVTWLKVIWLKNFRPSDHKIRPTPLQLTDLKNQLTEIPNGGGICFVCTLALT